MGLIYLTHLCIRAIPEKNWEGGGGGGGEGGDWIIKNLKHLLPFFLFYPIKSIVTFSMH